MEQIEKTFWQKYKKYFIWAVVIIGLIILIIYPIRVYNYCNTTEVDVIAQQKQCKLNMSEAMTQTKLSDKVLTREEQKLIEAMNIAVSRYDKIEGAWAWIQEQNLQVSAESYKQVRQTMEIYYAKFYAAQTTLNDRARAYEHKRSTLLFGFTSRLLGFPTQKYIDARIDEFVLEDGVQKTYDSKERIMPEIPMGAGDTAK